MDADISPSSVDTPPPARKALTVWLLQTGQPLHTDAGNPRPMRMMNLANALVAAGHRVVFWSSGFDHRTKRHRSRKAEGIRVSEQLEVRLVPSPGYRRHIGPKRLIDHAVLAWNLKRLLRDESVAPDVAFVGYPPIETAAVMTRWLAERRVPTLLDVKDLWPSLFLDPLPPALRPIGRVALAPYYYLARRAMREASGVTAMSESYLEWALDLAKRKRIPADRVVPLTMASGGSSLTARSEADGWWDERGVARDPGAFRVIFVGSFISGFDFAPVRAAAAECVTAGARIEFVLCGDGPTSGELRAMMAGLPNVHFPGWIDLEQLRSLAARSHAALAPHRNIDNFTKNLPNKVIDSLALGLPILSPLEGEVARLITDHQVGLRYGAGAGRTLYESLRELAKDPLLRQRLSKNARALYDAEFTFEKVYGGLVTHLERLTCAAGTELAHAR